jgi:transcriptional regulator with AAA-type ATPase domain
MKIKKLAPEIVTLEAYLQNPGRFSVLVLGERGIGKTSAINEIAKRISKAVIIANCASFANDTMAESELFGYPKGAFTGANKGKDGFFKDAENNILFLDEIHTLPKIVQQKLMTALQTESSEDDEIRGSFKYRRFGETEAKHVKFTPIFASNQSISKLKDALLPDFYDRIAQLIVEFPSLEEKKADLYQVFSTVWDNMCFKQVNDPLPKVEDLKKWLKTLHLDGNYRDLEKIAINWHQQRLIKYGKIEKFEYSNEAEREIFNEVKNNFIKYHQSPSSISISFNGFNFQKGKSKKKHELEYEKALLEWALSDDGYGNNKLAQEGLSYKGRINDRLDLVNDELSKINH